MGYMRGAVRVLRAKAPKKPKKPHIIHHKTAVHHKVGVHHGVHHKATGKRRTTHATHGVSRRRRG